MIHLTRFLVGIRHKRIFRIRSLSGVLIDQMIEGYGDKFHGVKVTQNNEEILFHNEVDYLKAKFSRDDIIVEGTKIYDVGTRGYVEVDKDEVVGIAQDALAVAIEALKFKDDFHRVGMIFEFRVPLEEYKSADGVGGFIKEKWISFYSARKLGEASLRFAYKLGLDGGDEPEEKFGYKNIIVQIENSKGIDTDGVEKPCLSVQFDMQRIFAPAVKRIDIKDHFLFCKKYIDEKFLPHLKEAGVVITW